MLRAAYFAQEILSTFVEDVHAVSLQPSLTSGKFAILINDEEIFDRKTVGAFPEIKQLKQLLRDKINPEKSLGHSDKKSN
jgi:selenoprotein W-related protein